MISVENRKWGSCMRCLALAAATVVSPGCYNTKSESAKTADANRHASDTEDLESGQGQLDDRLIGQWEHIVTEDEKYPAGKDSLFPPGTKSIFRFESDGILTTTTVSTDRKETHLKRRWRVKYTFPNTKDSFLLKRRDLETPYPSVGTWMSDVVHFIDSDTITIQGPIDIQPFKYKRQLISETESRTKR